MNHALLKIVASVALGNVPTGDDATFPVWSGPDATVVHVQAILYSSLLASLLAAFVAMLGKQWLNRYAEVERGSIVERGRHRKRKMDGMVTWKFGLVMECLPLMLQAALLLLGYALSDYLFFINRVVASVVIGFTTFGLLFYLLIVSAATLSYNCPFQTPASVILRLLIRFDSEHEKYLERSGKRVGRIISLMQKRWTRPKFGGPRGFGESGTFDGDIELVTAHSADQPSPLFTRETDWDGYTLDSDCITWMFETPMDTDDSLVIARFIPEIVWHAGIQTTPLDKLYETFFECFDHSYGRPVLKPTFREKAYLSAKALIYMGIQRKCISNESEKPVFESIMNRHQTVGFKHYEGDSDLESALCIIDRIFGGFKNTSRGLKPLFNRLKYHPNTLPNRGGLTSLLNHLTATIPDRLKPFPNELAFVLDTYNCRPTFDDFEPIDWQKFTFTAPHRAWMTHILVYCAWDVTRGDTPFPDGIKKFILHSIQSEPPPPEQILADCLFMIGLALGIKLHIDDLSVVDKR